MLGAAIENYAIAEKTGSTSPVSMNTPRLRRLWWSIVLRDGFISLAFRRSAQIGWSDPNLKAQFPNEKDFEDDIAHSEVYDEATKRLLVRIFEKQYQFAVIVIEMMSAFFPQKDQCSYESIEELSRALKEIKDVRYAFSFWERGSHEALSPELEAWPDSVLGITNMTRAYYLLVPFANSNCPANDIKFSTARIHLIHCEAFILQSNRSISTEENLLQMRKSTPDLRHAVTEVHQVMAYMSDAQKRETIPLSM